MPPNGAPERGMTGNLTGPPRGGSGGSSPANSAAIGSGYRRVRSTLTGITLFGILIVLQNAALAAQSAGYTDRIAAIVNGAVILESDVKAYKQPFMRNLVNLPLGVIPPGKWPTEREILEELVVLQLLEQDAARKGVTLDDRAVDASIDSIQKRNNLTHDKMVMFLAANGLSYAEFRKMMVRQFRLTKLIESEVVRKVPLNEDDAQRYFKENQDKVDEQYSKLLESLRPARPPEDQGGKPEIPTHEEIFEGGSVRLRQITLKVPPDAKRQQIEKVMATAKLIFQEVLTGADFANLAKRYSQDSLAKNGGDLGEMQYNSMVPALQKMVQRLRPGDVTPPLQSKEAVMIFYLADAKGRHTKQVPIPEKMRKQMEERLKQEYERQGGKPADQAQAAGKAPKEAKPRTAEEPAPAADTADNSKSAGGILTPEEEKEYKKVREKVITILRTQKTQERMKEWIEQLRKDSIIEVKL